MKHTAPGGQEISCKDGEENFLLHYIGQDIEDQNFQIINELSQQHRRINRFSQNLRIDRDRSNFLLGAI